MREKIKPFWILAVPIILLCISVTPVLSDKVIIDERVTVQAYGYRAWPMNTEYEGVKFEIEIDVVSGNDINLYVLDIVLMELKTYQKEVFTFIFTVSLVAIVFRWVLFHTGKVGEEDA